MPRLANPSNSPRRSAGLWLLVLSTIIVVTTPGACSQGNNYTLEVCGNAEWRDTIFLKGPSSQQTFDNITDWTATQIADYAKTTIIPQVTGNLAFLVMALVTLLIFLLWRLIRQCCMCCCMKRSCAEKRASADPEEVLSGWQYWLQKGLVWLFAVAALAMMLAGIIIAPKELFVKIWTPVDHFGDYLNGTTVSMERLVSNLDGVKPIMTNLTSIAKVDINFLLLTTNLKTISTALDNPDSNPAGISSRLAQLDTSITDLRAKMTSLRTDLGSQGVGGRVSTMSAGMSGWATATATLGSYRTLLFNLEGELTTLSEASGPVYATGNLKAAADAVTVPAWQANVNSLIATLDAWKAMQQGNQLGALATSITTINTQLTTLQTNLPVIATTVTSFMTSWSAALASLKAVLDQLDSIQANVMGLDADSNNVVVNLRTIYDSLVKLQGLQFNTLASNLTALVPDLTLGSSATMLVTSLDTLQTALNATPSATLDDARTVLADFKTALDALATPKANVDAAIAAYIAAPSATTFATMKTQADTNTRSLVAAAKTKANTAANNNSVITIQNAVLTSSMAAKLTAVSTNMATVDAAAATCQASLNSKVPSLDQYKTLSNDVNSVYAQLPTQPSKFLDDLIATLDKDEDLFLTVPQEVNSQVTNIQSSFGEGVQTLRKDVVGKLDTFETENSEKVETYDLARYRYTCVLFAVAAFFVVVLIVVVAINCPWGIGCAIFFLLVMAALLFLLAILFAGVLVGLQDACYHTEYIITSNINSDTVDPLLDYYFFGSNSTSVKTLLKEADLVDVDKVTTLVVNKTDGIINSFNETFTPRQKLQNLFLSIRAFVNLTLSDIDVILKRADVIVVRPLYIEVKSFPCCEIADYSWKAWIMFTFGGWLLMITAILAMAFLSRLDRLPQSGCCGCKPLLKSRMKNKVHPEDGGESGKQQDHGVKAVVLDAPGQQQMAPYPGQQQPYPSAPPGYQTYGAPPPAYGPPPPAWGPQPYGAGPHYLGATAPAQAWGPPQARYD